MNRPSPAPAGAAAGRDAVVIVAVPFDHGAAQRPVGDLYAEQLARYGHADAPTDTPAAYCPPAGLFLLAYLGGTPVGCGGYRSHDGGHTVELRRLYVSPEARGRGLGRDLLVRLEQQARAAGARRIVFETGARSNEMLALAPRLGYQPIPRYRPDRDPAINRAFGKDV